jgi:hypothetical protein
MYWDLGSTRTVLAMELDSWCFGEGLFGVLGVSFAMIFVWV